MQITLNQDEIITAVQSYVMGHIVLQEGQMIDVDLKAGRGENGFSATLDITPVTNRKVSDNTLSQSTSTKDVVPSEEPITSAPTPTKTTKTSPFAKLNKTSANTEKTPEEPVQSEQSEKDTEALSPEVQAAIDALPPENEKQPKEVEEDEEVEQTAPAPKKAGSIFNFNRAKVSAE